MEESDYRLLNIMLVIHLVTASITGWAIYSPRMRRSTFAAAMRFVVFPLMAFSGGWMFAMPRLKKP